MTAKAQRPPRDSFPGSNFAFFLLGDLGALAVHPGVRMKLEPTLQMPLLASVASWRFIPGYV